MRSINKNNLKSTTFSNGKIVMPLKNGTQKNVELGPDFRRDDEEGVAKAVECRLIIAVGQSIGG